MGINWHGSPMHVDMEGGARRQPGLSPTRRAAEGWVFHHGVDPDYLRAGDLPPPDVQAALEDVMGPERMKDLKLRIHPLYKRWTLFQRYRDPKGATKAWTPVSVFMEEAREGYLPSDLRGSRLSAHLEGQIGDFRVPHKGDFEIIEKADVRKYGAQQVEATLAEPEKKAERDYDSNWDNYIDDFHDYHFKLAMWEANERAGLHKKPWSNREITPHTNRARYRITNKGGWQLRERIWGDEGDLNALQHEVDNVLDGKPQRLDDIDIDAIIARRKARKERGRVRVTFAKDGSRTEEVLDEKRGGVTKEAAKEQSQELEMQYRRRQQAMLARKAI